jgi:hypothetical protein
VGLWIFANYTFLKRIHGEEDHKEDYNQAPTEWPPKAWQPSPEDAEKLEKQEVPIAAEFAKVLGENVPLPSPPPSPSLANHLPSHCMFPLPVGSFQSAQPWISSFASRICGLIHYFFALLCCQRSQDRRPSRTARLLRTSERA